VIGRPTSRARGFAAHHRKVGYCHTDALTGTPPEEPEQFLSGDLDAITHAEAEVYAHLDDESRVVSIEVDRALGAPDPSRPEPSHIEAEAGDEE